MRRGYLTVYLSLTLAVMISLILTLVEGARISATKMRAACVADIGINSTLSEYNRELFEQYDLLFVDMQYGGLGGSVDSVRAHLAHYLTKNLDDATPVFSRDLLGMKLKSAAITEYALATDNDAEAVLRQVADYMDTTLKGMLISGLDDLMPSLSGSGFDYDTSGKWAEVQGEIDAIGPPMIENEEGELVEVPINNPADGVRSLRNAGILGLVLNNTSEISKTKVDLSSYISHRQIHMGNGISDEERAVGRSAGPLTYDEYLFDKCGYYLHLKEGSLLSYEIEYIIKAHDCDWDNLEAVCRTLCMWREGINYLYLLGDSGKCGEAEALATTLAAVLINPELKEPIKQAILLAWAFVEALQDIKILLEGDGVDVVKSAQTWHTPLTAIFHPRSALKSYPGQPGPKYGDYLKTMLLMTSFGNVLIRSLDVMEMDVRLTPGNSNFMMDYCLQSFVADIATRSTHGHNTEVIRRCGYYYAKD